MWWKDEMGVVEGRGVVKKRKKTCKLVTCRPSFTSHPLPFSSPLYLMLHNTMDNNPLTLNCLVDGLPTSRAFSIKIAFGERPALFNLQKTFEIPTDEFEAKWWMETEEEKKQIMYQPKANPLLEKVRNGFWRTMDRGEDIDIEQFIDDLARFSLYHSEHVAGERKGGRREGLHFEGGIASKE
jgi:hypothetical protein